MKLKNLVGQRFGALTVIERAPNRDRTRSRVEWACRCDCGKATAVVASSLTRGATTSCGCGVHRSEQRIDNLVGQRFGMLTVVSQADGRRSGLVLWLCQCDCGGSRITDGQALKWDRSTNCGCKRRTHGQSSANGKRTPTYSSWQNMIARCTQPSNPAYEHYKKRGITVCERWLSFENFLADMGERPAGMTIDRFPNNDGNYEPNNCRWATKREQANNRSTNVTFDYHGKTYTLAELAREAGVEKDILRTRLIRQTGWTVEGALRTPTILRKNRRAMFRA